ncbi:MAG: hypothetical protein EP346_14325 [Bacteroidetes bacterium]|nr:MAG: hypothetical protein EP346_14325 [Bacteroidota bacterium]
MNRQILKRKLIEAIGTRFAQKLSDAAGVSPYTVFRWFREDSYVNADIESACLTLIKEAIDRRAELQNIITN